MPLPIFDNVRADSKIRKRLIFQRVLRSCSTMIVCQVSELCN
jgi:hypothetical protein